MFYTFRQHNSGGSFHHDDNLSIEVVIEADDCIEANNIAESLGIYFNGVEDGLDCDCCGDRWCKAYYDSGVELLPKVSEYTPAHNRRIHLKPKIEEPPAQFRPKRKITI